MELSMRLCPQSPVPTVGISGEIDVESGPCLAGWLRSLMRAWGPVLALDLTGVRFIDCAGVSALLATRRIALRDGGSLHVIAASPCVRRIIRITGLQPVLGECPLVPADAGDDAAPRPPEGVRAAGSTAARWPAIPSPRPRSAADRAALARHQL